MPRLHHLADANPFDFYDSLALVKDARPALVKGLRLFGSQNISALMDRSNIQVAGYLACDQTSMIQNLYARTNLCVEIGSAVKRALHEWANSTTVILVVGDKPQRMAPLSSLLLRKAGDRDADAIPLDEAASYFDDLAKSIWYDAADVRPHDMEMAWSAMPPDVKNSWLKVARAAHHRLKAPQITIVPPRQHISVVVQSNEVALAKLLELIPPGISPMPLVWIHLEGFSRRDVC